MTPDPGPSRPDGSGPPPEADPVVAALARAEERLRLVALSGRLGLWELDVEEGSLWCDEGVAAILGRDDLVGPGGLERWFSMIEEDERDRARQNADHTLRTGEFRPSTYAVRRPDGERRWIQVQGLAVTNEGGAITRLAGLITDVTDAHREAQQVTEMLDALHDACVALDGNWRILYANLEAERALGVPKAELVGRDAREVFPDARNAVFGHNYRKVLSTGQPVEFEAHEATLDRWFEVRAFPAGDGLTAFFRDVTERNSAREERDRLLVAERTARHAAEQIRDQLEHLATHDSLTGLRNRLAFEHWLSNALGRRHEAHHPVAVCLLDLDRFKLINDGFGHLAGDKLLVEVAGRLEHLVRPQDVVARLGGDEFVIGLEDLTPEQVEAVADRALAAVRRPVQVEGRELVVTTTVGIAFGGPDASPETMLRDADVAMYRAKEQGKNRAAIFDQSVRAALLRHLRVEGDLRRGIAGDELLLVHQPNFDLARGTRAGAEALVRWEHPELGLLGPGEFVPVAEESDLVVELGLWVLDRAVTQAARWKSEGLDLGGPLWINVSGRQLEDPTFPAAVARALAAHDMPAESIALEVTETALLRDPATVNRALDNLVGLGLRIAIDDFGTGYSSLARLATYPLDRLKIDRAFTARLDRDPTNPIVAGAVHLGHALGAVVCAEGVESAAQLRALRTLGADQAAGFLLARPVPADELAAAMEAGCSTLASIE